VVVAVALITAGLGLGLVYMGDQLAYELGMIEEAYPYPTKLHPELTPGTADSTLSSAQSGYQPLPSNRRLVIPSLGIDVPIGEEEASALARGVWHHPGSARPGESGNMALAGHRVWRVFSLLGKLDPGDEVIVYWDGDEYDYLVGSATTVMPDETNVISRDGADRLTMYTCLPRYMGNKRTVVVAYPVTGSEVAGLDE
jgi:LPXTG-site transpeptidase (sortase) family protein